eukprot:21361-Heterococcus_DN1.PRE.10
MLCGDFKALQVGVVGAPMLLKAHCHDKLVVNNEAQSHCYCCCCCVGVMRHCLSPVNGHKSKPHTTAMAVHRKASLLIHYSYGLLCS